MHPPENTPLTATSLPQVAETLLRYIVEDNEGSLRISKRTAQYLASFTARETALDPDSQDIPRLITSQRLRDTAAHRENLRKQQALDNKRNQEARECFAALTDIAGIDRKLASSLTQLVAQGNSLSIEFVQKLLTSKK